MTEPMLVVKNLCLDILKDGKPLPILRDVSFEIHEGENWGIAVTGHKITVGEGMQVAPKQILSESI